MLQANLGGHFGRSFWRVNLAAQFGESFWRVILAGLFGCSIWRVNLAAQFGGSFWRLILAGQFGRSFWRMCFNILALMAFSNLILMRQQLREGCWHEASCLCCGEPEVNGGPETCGFVVCLQTAWV
jgi:hypothetical protein